MKDKTQMQRWTEPRRKTIGVPLEKSVKKNDDGSVVVRGFFTSDRADELGDIITRGATERAIPKYRQWGNIRYMHLPQPVAKVVSIGAEDGLEWNEVEIKVIDPKAVFEVEQGLLQALSVGILINFEDIDFLEDGGLIINDYLLAEISLVDHPANYDAVLTGMKGMLDEIARTDGSDAVLKHLDDLRACYDGACPVDGAGEKSMETNTTNDTVDLQAEPVEVAAIEAEPVEAQVTDVTEVQAEGVVEENKEMDADKSAPCREDGESKEDCVDRKVPEILDENTDMEQDQAVAIAEDMCDEPCDDGKAIDAEIQPVEGEQTEEEPATPADRIEQLSDMIAGLATSFMDFSQTVTEALQKATEAQAKAQEATEQAEGEQQTEEKVLAEDEPEDDDDPAGVPGERKGALPETVAPTAENDAEPGKPAQPADLRMALRSHFQRNNS